MTADSDPPPCGCSGDGAASTQGRHTESCAELGRQDGPQAPDTTRRTRFRPRRAGLPQARVSRELSGAMGPAQRPAREAAVPSTTAGLAEHPLGCEEARPPSRTHLGEEPPPLPVPQLQVGGAVPLQHLHGRQLLLPLGKGPGWRDTVRERPAPPPPHRSVGKRPGFGAESRG